MPLDSTTYETPVMTLLRRARALLSRPRGWTQGGLAVDKEGESIDTMDSDATAFCMLGALEHEAGARRLDVLYYDACRELAMTIRPGAMSHGGNATEIIPDYNDADNRQKRTILRAFDRTIARIRAMVTAA